MFVIFLNYYRQKKAIANSIGFGGKIRIVDFGVILPKRKEKVFKTSKRDLVWFEIDCYMWKVTEAESHC